jgi:hypothetical protein
LQVNVKDPGPGPDTRLDLGELEVDRILAIRNRDRVGDWALESCGINEIIDAGSKGEEGLVRRVGACGRLGVEGHYSGVVAVVVVVSLERGRVNTQRRPFKQPDQRTIGSREARARPECLNDQVFASQLRRLLAQSFSCKPRFVHGLKKDKVSHLQMLLEHISDARARYQLFFKWWFVQS